MKKGPMNNKSTLKKTTKSKTKNNPIVSVKKGFPVIGIGASAGGLDALESFFKNTPDKTGMAFVVILHLDPDRVSMIPELLQRIHSNESHSGIRSH